MKKSAKKFLPLFENSEKSGKFFCSGVKVKKAANLICRFFHYFQKAAKTKKRQSGNVRNFSMFVPNAICETCISRKI